jgi:hypothetical protein
MIGPVSTTGKAMLESLQNAMSKGMPVEQAISYVKSLAMDGVAPLTDLYSMMLQFQRLKQPTRRPPEGGSIREQLESLRNPMEMGLGSMNAGVMENPQGFNAGGIVAFDNGGAAQSAPAGITPQLYGPVPKFTSYDEQAEFYNRLLQDPEFLKKQMAEREALAKQQGFDEFGQSFKLRENLLKEDQKRAETVAAEEAGYDEEEYWGDVASNAAESGATLLTSLAKAQKGKATRKRATAEKARLAIREAKNTEILLEQAREAEREGRLKDAEALRAKAYESAMGARKEAIDARNKAESDKAMREAMKYQSDAGIRAAAAGLSGVEARLAKQIEADPTLTAEQKLEKIRGLGKRQSGDVVMNRQKLIGIDARIKSAEAALAKPESALVPEIKESLQATLEDLKMQRAMLLNESPELNVAPAGGAPTGTSNLPPGFVRD